MRRSVSIAGRCGLAGALVVAACLSGAEFAKADEPPAQAAAETVRPESAAVAQPVKEQPKSDKEPPNGQLPKTAKELNAEVTTGPGTQASTDDLDLQQLPPIHGFHPIKSLVRPMEQLELVGVRLHKQILKMEAPIAALQPSLQALQKTVVHVDERMNSVEKQLGNVESRMDSMHTGLNNVGERVTQVQSGMTSLREDLKEIRGDLTSLRDQVNALQKPLVQIRDPLLGVAGPLSGLHNQLNNLQALVGLVLLAIALATVGIAIGTPVAAFLLHRNRDKFFPPKLSG